jgi:hypothetical protein
MRTKAMKYVAMLIAVLLSVGQIWAQAAGSGEGQQMTQARQVDQIMAQLSRQVDQMETQLVDWANLNRYRKENAELPPVA